MPNFPRYLIVGDYHAETSDLEDCKRLADLIVETAKAQQAIVVFTGDQYHTHAIIHAEVQLFWFELYTRLQNEAHGSISLIGNHDKPGSASSKASAMLAHTTQTIVVREPTVLNGILFLPYYDDKEAFITDCKRFPGVHTLICHQTFDGSTYDNGFYAKDGVDPNLIPQKLVISGHIHTPQEFGKVWYVGAPRWRTLSDADVDRAIWLVVFDGNGHVIQKHHFDTGTVCRKIRTFVDNEENWTDSDGEVWAPPFLNTKKDEWNVDIYGSAKYIETRVGIYKTLGCRIRTFRTDIEQADVKESDGFNVAYEKFMNEYKARYGTPKEALREMVKKRNGI